jgi:predicted dehydrogenase
MVDMIHFWGEEFCEVFADSGIFIKERPSEETGEMTAVDTDDWCNITAKLKSEASCTIQLSRCATTVPDIVEFELYGEKGKIIFSHIQGTQSLEFTDALTKEKEIIEVPAEFDAVQSRSFVDLAKGIEDEYTAKLSHGLQCQAVIDAALISTKENRVVTIGEITEEL